VKALAASALAVVVLAGCGGGGSSPPAQPAGSIMVTMTEYKFDPSTINAPAGKVVFFVVNAGNNISHDMIIKDSAGKRIAGSSLVSAGDSVVFTVDSIAAGKYTYVCDQPGHEASGMKGTLTIT
jgi:plastocyanin